MSYTLSVGPTEEPVALEDLKRHCRVEITEDDDLIVSLGLAAREKVELDTGRALCSQTWIYYSNTFPTCDTTPIELDHPPLQSCTIAYTNTSGVGATWTAGLYQVDTSTIPGRILPAYGQSYPTARDVPQSVAVTFLCGYGQAHDVPAQLCHAIKMLVGTWYEYRETIASGGNVTSIPAPAAYEALIYPYRLWSF
jgi:uncharacterized phiE125 gp8 family phage protein